MLYISYSDPIKIDENHYALNCDTCIYGSEIDHFMEELEKFGYEKSKITEIKKLMEKKDKWYKYWEDHDWDGNYSFTSKEIWKEILGDMCE